MAKGVGGTKENPYYAREIRAGEPSPRRVSDNHREANRLESEGYYVERDLNKNGAYFAVIGDTHKEHEQTVGRIFAENGISASLDREGMIIRMPDGRKFKLPTADGHLNKKYSFEIYALQGKADARTVAEGITHSYKFFRNAPDKSVQADFAVTIAPIGSDYHRAHIDNGVREYIRRVNEDGNKARPLAYLHIDETTRKIYYRDIKKRE